MALVLDPERYETHAFGWCCEPQRTAKRVMEEAVRLWAESHGWTSIAHCIRAGRFKVTGSGAGDVQGYEYHQFDRALRQMLSRQRLRVRTIGDRLLNLGWEYPEILADLDELAPDRSGPSERAQEVLALDCSSQVGRLCHVLIDGVESIRPDYRPTWFDAILVEVGIEPGEVVCPDASAISAMLTMLHG